MPRTGAYSCRCLDESRPDVRREVIEVGSAEFGRRARSVLDTVHRVVRVVRAYGAEAGARTTTGGRPRTADRLQMVLGMVDMIAHADLAEFHVGQSIANVLRLIEMALYPSGRPSLLAP